MEPHIHMPAYEGDFLLFQELALPFRPSHRAERMGQDAPSRPHHPVPGEPRGTAVHGPTHLPGHVGSSEQGGNLAIGQHSSGGNRAHHPVHLLEEGSFFRVGQESSLVVAPPALPGGSYESETIGNR